MSIFYQAPDATIHTGHVLDVLRALADESVHCCVTSPPYYGLRDYGIEPQVWGGVEKCQHEWGDEKPSQKPGQVPQTKWANVSAVSDGQKATRGAFCRHCNAWRGSLGLEPTPDLFVEHMVEVFREVRRILRRDAVCWLNLGDSYNSCGGHTQPENDGRANRQARSQVKGANVPGLKPKDLLLMPFRVALALQADGWWIRSSITWCKKSAMPESVTDRPTSATEQVFLLAKAERYYYDSDAVRETAVSDHPSGNGFKRNARLTYLDSDGPRGNDEQWQPDGSGRNLRNFWLLGPEPFPLAHFATFPTEIPRRCILAGTSERGVCAECGKPWRRVVERVRPDLSKFDHRRTSKHDPGMRRSDGDYAAGKLRGEEWNRLSSNTTLGWQPTCTCNAEAAPATVLDPFLGSGTTMLVAREQGRHSIGIELNPDYAEMSVQRLQAQTPRLALEETT